MTPRACTDSPSLGSLLKDSERPFARFLRQGDFTEAQLSSLADRVAQRLLDRGLTGRPVVILSDLGPMNLAFLFGCFRAGALACPLDVKMPKPQCQELLGSYGADLVLTDREHLSPWQGEVLFCNSTSLRETPPPARRPEVLASAPAICVHTSGSTGLPKGIVLSHGSLRIKVDHYLEVLRLGPSDRGYCVLPMSHINGFVTTLLTPLVSGGTMVYADLPFEPRAALRNLAQNGCTWFSGVPVHYRGFLSVPEPSPPLSKMKFFRSAAAPLSKQTIVEFETRFGVPIIESMGMSEAASQIFSNLLPPHPRIPGSVGKPIGVSARIADGSGRCLGPNEVGEIQVQGPALMEGYLNDPDSTKKAFTADGWLKTGDLGSYDADGFYTIRGRIKDIAIFCGINISLVDLRHRLESKQLVDDVTVSAEGDENFGERVVIYAVPTLQGRPVEDRQSLRQNLSEAVLGALPHAKSLKGVRLVEEIPRSGSGKVLAGRLATVSEA
jgi:acyl-CoA synthetase (AMP-forming)/AMP-acid ligase II